MGHETTFAPCPPPVKPTEQDSAVAQELCTLILAISREQGIPGGVRWAQALTGRLQSPQLGAHVEWGLGVYSFNFESVLYKSPSSKHWSLTDNIWKSWWIFWVSKKRALLWWSMSTVVPVSLFYHSQLLTSPFCGVSSCPGYLSEAIVKAPLHLLKMLA